MPLSTRPNHSSHLSSLNPAQREAATTLSGPLLVLAGAGTGKTRVITYRMIELIRNGVAPDKILSVTFTNKASREMQERMTSLLEKKLPAKPFISTFHSLCVRILREEISLLGYPNKFVIYDRGDQESAARSALRDIRVNDKSLRPGDLLNRISGWKMAGISPEEATNFTENDFDFLAAMAYRKYQTKLRSSGAVDFDDLLMLTNELFSNFPEALKKTQNKFEYVQIDEYQDTNLSQFNLIRSLVEPHQNLCVVGDDDQSIYGWRGAEVRHILGFQNQFPGAKVVRLENNYRCTDKIIEIANRLVAHNRDRHKKQLIAHKKMGPPVRFLDFTDELTEAEKIVGEIRYLHEAQETPLRDFAILFRTNEQPRVFETELRRTNVRYQLIGSQSFFDRREIRDLLAYLKTLAFPNDELSMLRIINTPTRGIGNGTIEKLVNQSVKEGNQFWDTVASVGKLNKLNARASTGLDRFHDLLKRYRTRLNQSPRDLAVIMQDLIKEIDYESEIKKQYKTSEQQQARIVILEQFIESIKEYCQRSSEPTPIGFLEEIALGDRDNLDDKEDQLAQDAVKLMTLHSAKGLEFPRVYLVGMEEGLLPHKRSVEGTDSEIAEERRIAYVGITRAQDYLTLSRATTRTKWGKKQPTLPSRFLFEMRNSDEE
ncbi:MAG: exodeoxyribonuclease V subunit gamma [Planctomycetes bacterium]|nr:exodeoxyribonuclease V subunit gamma [Planctomycetota bacterium]MCH9723458.1 exodeoxyribonuclease V subunit gamma [Planctomycetota bacterium]MCH9775188.1 exodeoxyribonuclease V subunit gamma [Planctomycetota bacterium]MDF1745631.1 exodeoxyribonuclease V subunit gamma [Gimesia sp.]